MSCLSQCFQAEGAQTDLDIVDNDQGPTDASDRPVVCDRNEDTLEIRLNGADERERPGRYPERSGCSSVSLTKARLEDVISVESLYMGLVRHVSAEPISGRHDCCAFLLLCNPRLQR